jgi:hypothetical protein
MPFAICKILPAIQNLEKTQNFLKEDTTDITLQHHFVASDLYNTIEDVSYVFGNFVFFII